MKKTIFCVGLLSGTFNAVAQNHYKATVGASFDYGFKITTKQNLGVSSYEPSIYVKIDGAEENSLGFICRFGFIFDSYRFPIGSGGTRVDLIQNNFTFSGLICFPTKNENIKIMAGIGLELGNKPLIGFHKSSVSSLLINSDSFTQIFEDYRRRVLPSISAGVFYKPFLNKKIGTFVIFKKTLLQLFTEDIEIPYKSGGISFTTSTNYQPTYFKFGVSYDFW